MFSLSVLKLSIVSQQLREFNEQLCKTNNCCFPLNLQPLNSNYASFIQWREINSSEITKIKKREKLISWILLNRNYATFCKMDEINQSLSESRMFVKECDFLNAQIVILMFLLVLKIFTRSVTGLRTIPRDLINIGIEN